MWKPSTVEDETGRLLQAVCEPVVASPEFRERMFKDLTQEVSRQALQLPRVTLKARTSQKGQKGATWPLSQMGVTGTESERSGN